LATAELLLDGNTIEGVGISPDIKIDYSVDKSIGKDPQLERAIKEIGKIL
jgi:C-terminal processing protease CtpA/Prc